MSDIEFQVALWDAINAYAATCGGDPGKRVYGNTPRQTAVSAVNRAIAAHVRELMTKMADARIAELEAKVARLKRIEEAAWEATALASDGADPVLRRALRELREALEAK